jgi:hypothetical protein
VDDDEFLPYEIEPDVWTDSMGQRFNYAIIRMHPTRFESAGARVFCAATIKGAEELQFRLIQQHNN